MHSIIIINIIIINIIIIIVISMLMAMIVDKAGLQKCMLWFAQVSSADSWSAEWTEREIATFSFSIFYDQEIHNLHGEDIIWK